MLVHLYLVKKSDAFMNELISKNLYNPNALIELKIKQNLPAINEWSDYKNVNGQIQLKNACYNYVKLKYTKDTLYVKIVPNYAKTKLIESNIINARQINDIPVKDANQHSGVKKGGADNTYQLLSFTYKFLAYEQRHSLVLAEPFTDIPQPFLPVQGRPPATLV